MSNTTSTDTTIVDKVKIDKQGRYTVTGKRVKTSFLEGKLAEPGTYKVTIEKNLDRIIDKEVLFSHLIRKLNPVDSVQCNSSATDGVNLMYNKEWMSQMPPDQQCGVLLHEVLHCAFLHLWRRGKRDMTRWNIACDYAINLLVNRVFPLPPGTLLDTQYADMSAEEIYDKLPTTDIKEQGWCQKLDWEGQGGNGNGQGIPVQVPKGFLKRLAETGKNKTEKEARDKAAAKSDAQKQKEWSDAFDQAFTQNYGTAPEYLKRAISQKHYIPVIDWAELVSKILSEDITDYTFSQPDRRFLDEVYILPDLYSWDRVKDVIFAYDTSGSISQDDLNAFYFETKELWKQFPNLTGHSAVCDWVIHSFKDIDMNVTKDEINFQGGGGTSFEPVFEEIEKRNLKPKALFYFTDTYGSFPDKDPGYPVFWLVHSYVGDTQDHSNVPWGKVIKFMNRSQLNNPMQKPGGRW